MTEGVGTAGGLDCAPGQAARHARFPALDAMRGGAAMVVMLYHIGIASGHPQLAPFGFLAVDLFFMMSGFVIAKAYEPRLRDGLPFRAFVGLRIGRIYPMLAAGVLIGAAVAAVRGGPASIGVAALRSLLLLPDWSGHLLFPLNPVLWSLFYELVANLLHASLARHLTTRRIAIAALVAGALFAAAIYRYHEAGFGWGAQNFAEGFARAGWGYLTGMLIARVRIPTGRSAPLFPLVGLALLIAPATGFVPVRVIAMLFLAFPLALLGAVRTPHCRWPRLAAHLGNLSYPLYAMHQPLVMGAAAMMPSPYAWAGLALALILLAAVTGRYIDAPAQILLRRLLAGRRGAPTPGSAPATPPSRRPWRR
ncbi:acyltransferase family protein [Sphingomonas oligoaromativorans]|uniref:acyltransferase family protein n=1 Tax=Sphingomonas oligoaromativorans TaxID=575322 RepID=UPI00141DF897|nr:peptidoglycan/LPS O-acetylase OafA/YrhL [Sphingomonas oligoaromativorans]